MIHGTKYSTKVWYYVGYKVQFLVSEIYTTMLAGLVMDVNLLRMARFKKKGSCTKFQYMIHGTKYSTKYGTMYGTR